MIREERKIVKIDRVTGRAILEKDEWLISAPPHLKKRIRNVTFLIVRRSAKAENTKPLTLLRPWEAIENVERR